jgi:formylglycine-generating enzyme required for sulfatase activity
LHPSIIITDLNGSRRLRDEQLPLSIGTEQNAHIRLPEWDGRGSFAQISMLDDRCFVQPQSPQVTLKLNGVSLVTPKWLDDGDVLSVGDAEIELHDDGDEIELEVFLGSEETETAPPTELPVDLGVVNLADQAESAEATPTELHSASSDTDAATSSTEIFSTEPSAANSDQDAAAYELDSEADNSVKSHDRIEDIAAIPLDDPDEFAEPMVAREASDISDATMVPLPEIPHRESTASVADQAPPRQRSWFVRACWVLLLLVVAYVALSSKVAVKTLPAGADVAMEPRWMSPGRAGRFFLLPGHYDFVVAAPGYESAQGSLDVEFMERKNLSVQLQEKPGRLGFDLPAGVAGELWIDGELAAKLDALPIPLAKGVHEFRIVTSLYQEFSGSVDVMGRDELQIIAPDLAAEWGSFAVATQPAGAEIFLGEQLLGTTPATVDVPAGQHELELRLQGYSGVRKPINAVAGAVEMLPIIEMQQIGASIQVITQPAGATVNLSGKFQGVTPVTIEAPLNQLLSVVIAKPGYESVTREVSVAENQPVGLDVALKPLSGIVSVEVSPADAELIVDGKNVGSANRELTLTALQHEIEIRKEGFQSWASRITPTPGVPQRIDVSLLSDSQARLASLPGRMTSSLNQEFALVKPGELMLGSRSNASGRRANEVVRNVTLQRPFYIGLTEVTNREFLTFNNGHSSATDEFAELDAPNRPVVMLTWNEAAAFCNWLSDQEGLERAYSMRGGKLTLADPLNGGYRLPTEAEWAWVARYGGGAGERRFPWGSAMPPIANSGNFADTAAIEKVPNVLLGYDDGYALTADVGTFAPNALGAFDLGGNVAEWVNDNYSSAATSELQIDPVGPSQGQYHVIRGSSWRHSSVGDLRLAARDFGVTARMDVGFRLARYAPQIAVSESVESAESGASDGLQ